MTQPLGPARAAADRAAALLGVLGRPETDDDRLTAAVAEVLRAHGEPQPVRLSRADAAALRRVAPTLLAVFAAADTATAAARLNDLLAHNAGPPRLSAHDGTAWHLHADSGDDAPWAEWFVASSALALATLLAERQAPPGGLCESCSAPFVVSGRGGERRFCSPRCATRSRVAAHRRRHRPHQRPHPRL